MPWKNLTNRMQRVLLTEPEVIYRPRRNGLLKYVQFHGDISVTVSFHVSANLRSPE